MTLNEYQELAARTINPKLSNDDVENHALLGIVSEIGELYGLYQKVYQGHEFDIIHAKKELGDLMWFIAEYCTGIHVDLDDICAINIAKLKDRYPDGFNEKNSLNRKEGDI